MSMSIDLEFYLLEGAEVRRADVRVWAERIGDQRSVKQTCVPGGVVSTCFFGMNVGTVDRPVFFETALFTLGHNATYKFATMEAALKMHHQLAGAS